MQYFETIDLTSQVKRLLAQGALTLQPGQWVRDAERGVGRYLRTDRRTGVTYVSWKRPGETWETYGQRFHRACVKGFVGRYAPLYDIVKAEREAARALSASLDSLGARPNAA